MFSNLMFDNRCNESEERIVDDFVFEEFSQKDSVKINRCLCDEEVVVLVIQ